MPRQKIASKFGNWEKMHQQLLTLDIHISAFWRMENRQEGLCQALLCCWSLFEAYENVIPCDWADLESVYPKLQQIRRKGFGSYSCELFSVKLFKQKKHVRDLLGHLFFNWSYSLHLKHTYSCISVAGVLWSIKHVGPITHRPYYIITSVISFFLKYPCLIAY